MLNTYINLLKNSDNSSLVTTSETYQCQTTESDEIPEGLQPLYYRILRTSNQINEKALAVIWKTSEKIHVLAVMEDSDVFSNAEGINDRTWTKGDVMEFFCQPDSDKHTYIEVHAAPNECTLELAFSDENDVSRKDVPFENRFFNSGVSLETGSFNQDGFQGWWSKMSFPLDAINLTGPFSGQTRFAVCRYNYSHGDMDNPEVSSTAYYPSGGFHQPKYWHRMVF